MNSKEIIGKVLDSIRISEIVGKYVELKRHGGNFFGLCPFHNEKTGSFSVNDEKGIFHCFGCGETGNAVSFIMKYKELPFKKALLEVAQEAGIPVPDHFNLKNLAKEESFKEKITAVNHKAASLYHKLLLREDNPGIRYLKEDRKISPDLIEKFYLGYAPDSWEMVSGALKTSAPMEILKECGLFGFKESRVYDRFRNKVIFPIFDARGAVVAFGSRVLDNSKPKYINSPETRIFKKKELLYGLNFAVEEARKKEFFYIVEGYMDVIMMHQAGFTNAVAPLGTAFSEEHIRLARHYVKSVVFLFDGDEAGKKAARRSLEIALKVGFPAKIVTLPEGMDPYDFIVREGREKFDEFLSQNQVNWDDFLIGPAVLEKDILLRRRKVVEILKLFQSSDSFIADAFIGKLSEALSIEKQKLADYFYKNAGKAKTRNTQIPSKSAGQRRKPETSENDMERQLVFLFIHNPELYEKEKESITEAFFYDADGAGRLFSAFKNSFREGKFSEKIFYSELGEDLTKQFQKDIFIAENKKNFQNKYKIDPEKQINDIRLALRLLNIRQQKDELLEQIKEIERQKNREEISSLMRQLQELLKEEKELENKRKGV